MSSFKKKKLAGRGGPHRKEVQENGLRRGESGLYTSRLNVVRGTPLPFNWPKKTRRDPLEIPQRDPNRQKGTLIMQ